MISETMDDYQPVMKSMISSSKSMISLRVVSLRVAETHQILVHNINYGGEDGHLYLMEASCFGKSVCLKNFFCYGKFQRMHLDLFFLMSCSKVL